MELGDPRECSPLKMAGGVGPPKEPLSAPETPSWRWGKRAHIYCLHASGHPCCLTGTIFFPVRDSPGSHEHLALRPLHCSQPCGAPPVRRLPGHALPSAPCSCSPSLGGLPLLSLPDPSYPKEVSSLSLPPQPLANFVHVAHYGLKLFCLFTFLFSHLSSSLDCQMHGDSVA